MVLGPYLPPDMVQVSRYGPLLFPDMVGHFSDMV